MKKDPYKEITAKIEAEADEYNRIEKTQGRKAADEWARRKLKPDAVDLEKMEVDRKVWEHLSNLNKIHKYDEKQKAEQEELGEAFKKADKDIKEAKDNAKSIFFRK
jgi:hypothetical protein